MSHENSFVISVDLDEYKLHPKFGESITSASRRYNNNNHNHFTPRSPCKSNILEHLSLRNRESLRFNGYIPPKTNDSTLNELPESFVDSFKEEYDDEDDDERVPFSKWKQLSLVINSVCRLKNTEVVSIKSIGDLKTSLYDTGSCLSPGLGPHSLRGDIMYITAGQLSKQAMRDARDQAHFFKAIDQGNSTDYDYIKERLQKDPKKFIYSSDDNSCLTNKQDHRGYTPLYVACRNGNMKMVKLLLEFKANPYQYSQVTKTEKESILFVTARWGHVDLIELLTGHGFAWSKKEFYEAYKTASNKKIKDILKKKMATLEKGSRVSKLIDSRH